MLLPQPEVLDLLVLAVPQLTATVLTIKGIASVICNNLPTQKWGKVGTILDWLASNNKEAKKVGDTLHDMSVDDLKPKNKTIFGRILNSLS